MSLQSAIDRINESRKAAKRPPIKAVATPADHDAAITRVQVGKGFFHARAQGADESDERYAKYLEPHLAELAG